MHRYLSHLLPVHAYFLLIILWRRTSHKQKTDANKIDKKSTQTICSSYNKGICEIAHNKKRPL